MIDIEELKPRSSFSVLVKKQMKPPHRHAPMTTAANATPVIPTNTTAAAATTTTTANKATTATDGVVAAVMGMNVEPRLFPIMVKKI